MNRILLTAYKHMSKITVLHSIPGRFRVSVPGMEKLQNSEYRRYENIFISLIDEIQGINKVESNFITGNILINYNCSVITEEKIIAGLNHIRNELIDYFMDNGSKMTSQPENEIVSEIKILVEKEIKRL
ncbi:MAG: hypothetical protein GY756_26695 [bacterium]|nr:hypothetical protein [bacterium]